MVQCGVLGVNHTIPRGVSCPETFMHCASRLRRACSPGATGLKCGELSQWGSPIGPLRHDRETGTYEATVGCNRVFRASW